LQHLTQGWSVDQLHHVVERARFSATPIEQSDDVRTLQSGRGLHLSNEQPRRDLFFLCGEASPDHLECNAPGAAPIDPELIRAVNDPLPALTKQRCYLVFASDYLGLHERAEHSR